MRVRILLVFGALLVTAPACGSGGDSSGTNAETSTTARTDGAPPGSNDGSASTAAETSVVRAADVAPSGPPLVEGLPAVDALGPPESDAGEAPLFRWEPVAGASRYDVAVLGPNGPLWAWQGEETEIYLGGLPFERPPGWAGPVIEPGSCWSVMARGPDGHVVAVSEFLPVSPAASAGHTCVPGAGSGTG